MTRYAAKRDTNHAEIEAVFRKMLADHVTDTSSLGLGVGDLFVSFGALCYFIEIKSDSRITHRSAERPYTPSQVKFQRAHPHAVIRCESVDQAVSICANIRRMAAMIV